MKIYPPKLTDITSGTYRSDSCFPCQVIHQISRLLKVNQGDVKRAIDDNRLDWISAIYHLLMRDKELNSAAKLSSVSKYNLYSHRLHLISIVACW